MIIIPSYLEGHRSLKDKTIKLTFETNELNPQDILSILENTGQFGYLAFKREPFTEQERKVIEELETNLEDSAKTPSKRLRGILYRLWQSKPDGFQTFALYYEHTMERICEHYKNKIDQ